MTCRTHLSCSLHSQQTHVQGHDGYDKTMVTSTPLSPYSSAHLEEATQRCSNRKGVAQAQRMGSPHRPTPWYAPRYPRRRLHRSEGCRFVEAGRGGERGGLMTPRRAAPRRLARQARAWSARGGRCARWRYHKGTTSSIDCSYPTSLRSCLKETPDRHRSS